LSRLPVPQRGITLPKSDLIFYNNTINFIASACHLFIRFQIISNTTSIIQPCPLSGYKSYCLAAPKPLQF